jgi:hypothetical protein
MWTPMMTRRRSDGSAPMMIRRRNDGSARL